MPFIKRAKILSTRVYEFFEGGNIDTIATSPDKLVRRTNPATFSYLRKSGIHKTFGEFVIHTLQALAQRCPTKMKRGLTFSPFYLRPITARHVRFTPKSGHVQCTSVCPLCANSGHDCKIKSVVRFKVGLTPTEERNEVFH